MSPLEFEKQYQQTVAKLVSKFPSISDYHVASGGLNRLRGQSGAWHQIDVSLTSAGHIILVECKYLSRRVGMEAVLVLLGRLTDIRLANPGVRIDAVLVSTKTATRGACTVAKQYGIELDVMASPQEYCIRLGKRVFAAVTMRGKVSIVADAAVIRQF